ncbi:glycosyltransferase 87 family protein [Algoriphagus terrigena]|uniref:glycosyltransferase 87 family protein n=1 Tax=Algoriphagus terrigena TaxID=344884 RepID=UPI0004187F3D|nr:glycosyltransferase 87 family protein [Algoriphagus terrigena]
MKLAVQVLGLILMLAGVYFLGNLIPRTDFRSTMGLFVMLFGLMFLIFGLSEERTPWFFIFIAGLLLRFSLFLAIPQWSDDYARFLWDGELTRIGENPYAETPAEFLQDHPLESTQVLHQLFPLLNSKGYYSVYPPINQGIFWLSAKAANGLLANGIISLRLLLLLGEIGVFMLFLKLLKAFQLPQKLLWLYWLNPLVILEITANLHFEGLVLLLLLATVLALKNNQPSTAGSFWGLAIGVKLLPLLLLPGFVFFPDTKKNTLFWFGGLVAVLVSFFWLLLDSSWVNFSQSVMLYQGKFEFNASIYYLLRQLGFWVFGYNTIGVLSKLLSVVTLGLVVYFSWKKKPTTLLELMDLWVLIYLIYLILQPVVHPWYLIPAFGLSVLTGRNTFLVWSLAAIFSYSAYGTATVTESPLYLAIEYLLVLGGIYLDYFLPKSKLNLKS